MNPQRAADRTANVISKPEVMAEPVSTMERAFVDAFSGRVYKHVAILWSAWSRHASSRQKSSREVFADYRSFCDSFSTFCLLLVVRALSQFGISAAETDAISPIARGHIAKLSRPELNLSVVPNGAIRLSAGPEPLITFVPIPAAINRARTDAEL